MGEKELIKKLRILNTIRPDSAWASFAEKELSETIKVSESKSRAYSILPLLHNIWQIGVSPRPLAIAGSVFVLVMIFTAAFYFGGRGGESVQPSAEQNNGKTEYVRNNGNIFSAILGRKSKDGGRYLSADQKLTGNSAKTVKLGDEQNEEFRAQIIQDIQAKLIVIDEKISKLTSASDVKNAKKLLDEAKSLIDQGDLVDAFDALVSLDRLLNE